jgi:hypothetical protein
VIFRLACTFSFPFKRLFLAVVAKEVALSSTIFVSVLLRTHVKIFTLIFTHACSAGATLANMSNGKDVQIFPEPSQVADALAKLTIQAAERAIRERGSFTVALAGGSLIKLLGGLKGKSEVDWKNWHIFWVDERCVPHE